MTIHVYGETIKSKDDGLDSDPAFAGKDIARRAREKYTNEGWKRFRYEFVREAEKEE